LRCLPFIFFSGILERQLVDKKSVRFRRIWIDLWAGDSTVGCDIVNGGWLRAALKAQNDSADETSGIGFRDPLGAS